MAYKIKYEYQKNDKENIIIKVNEIDGNKIDHIHIENGILTAYNKNGKQIKILLIIPARRLISAEYIP